MESSTELAITSILQSFPSAKHTRLYVHKYTNDSPEASVRFPDSQASISLPSHTATRLEYGAAHTAVTLRCTLFPLDNIVVDLFSILYLHREESQKQLNRAYLYR